MLMCYHLGQDAVVDLDLDHSSMQVGGSTPLHPYARPRVDENLPAQAQLLKLLLSCFMHESPQWTLKVPMMSFAASSNHKLM